jgi:hypothetical protein
MPKANSAQKIVMITEADLTAATVLRINYILPDGTEGFFPGTLENGQNIVYNATDTETNHEGWWTFWAYAELPGFAPYRGYEVRKHFKY